MRSAWPNKLWSALPFRARLTLWNAVVVLLVAASALVGVREGLRWMLRKELVVSLDDEAFELAIAVDEARQRGDQTFEEVERAASGHMRHGWFVQFFDADTRRLLWSSRNTPADVHDVVFDPGASDISVGGSSYRLIYRDSTAASPQGYRLRLGTPLEFVQRDVNNVTRILSPVLLLVAILAPLGGYIMAGRATAPLRAIIETTRRLKPQRLEERLPIRGTRDELDQLSAETNKFLDEIADHLRGNREFVANAAHELRTPLTAIMASVDVALERTRTTAQYQELLATIQEECQQLTTLANQLLVLAQGEAGLLASGREAVALDRLASMSIEMFRGVAEEKGVDLRSHLHLGIHVTGNPLQLRQVVNNLIDNAVKFTPPGGQVEVHARFDASGERALLIVRDSGQGIPATDQPFVFDRFYKVDRARHHEEVVHGTGLGLSICRCIVEAHGGMISLESEPGRGATFTVALPVYRAPSHNLARSLAGQVA
jgi:signal transduction histidine kinase